MQDDRRSGTAALVYSTRKFVSSVGVLVSEFELFGMNGSISVAVTDAGFETFPPTSW